MAPPFASGGGGTAFEHQYGAVLLSHLLASTPIPALGDHVNPRRLAFQAKDASPVDDILVTGETASGDAHRLSIGARHKPKLTKSDPSSVDLVETYLQVVTEHWPDVEAGRWRLDLAVAPSHPPALQLDELTRIALAAGSDAEFREDVKRRGRTTDPVRNRLKRLNEIATDPAFNATGYSHSELTWRFLSHLSVTEVRLEGTSPVDRTNAIERLLPQTPDAKIPTAEKLYSRLTELVSGYAPNGARVTRDTLCTALRGHAYFKQADDEEPAADDGEIRSLDRAEALTAGPVEAIAGLAELVRSAREAIGADPSAAVQVMQQVAQRLERRGFRGNALLLLREFAKHLQAAGHDNHAAEVLTALVERLVGQGADYEAQIPAGELRRLHEAGGLGPGSKRAAHDALALFDTTRHPLDDLGALVDTFDALGSENGERTAVYALALAEAAVATDQLTVIAERADVLAVVADGASEKLTAVRIRLALAEAGGDWDDLVRQARRYKLPRPLAALVLARYARHLTLTARPDAANEAWWQAIERGALAELGDDTAEWLYAVRENARLYGPITEGFETHPQAQAMRLSRGRSLLPTFRDHHADALSELHNGDLASASESARRALRDAVTRGHLASELISAGLLADIYAASGEAARAAALYVRTGRGEKLTELLNRLGDQHGDLTAHAASPAPWQRYAVYKAIIAQADLVEDGPVEQLITDALRDVVAGLAGNIRQAPFPFTPQLEITALEAVASLLARGTAQQVREALELLAPRVPRAPRTYQHTDKGHVRALAAVLDRDDDFGPMAAEQLMDMLALNESVSQEVLEIASGAIARRVELFKDRLPELIETSFTAAWLLAQLNLEPPQDSQAVKTAFETLTAAYQQPPGVFGMGLPLARNAQLVRHLSRTQCDTAARAQLARARDRSQPAVNRSATLEALRILSGSVSANLKKELFEAGIAFAQGLEDGSALDDITGPAHPLSRFRVSLGPSSLAVPGIQLAAATAADPASAELVEQTAVPLLNGDELSVNGTVWALSWLPEHPRALPASALAIHGNHYVRAFAAVRWGRQSPLDAALGPHLASDPDYRVRMCLAGVVADMDDADDDAIASIRDTLSHDRRYSIRRAVARSRS